MINSIKILKMVHIKKKILKKETKKDAKDVSREEMEALEIGGSSGMERRQRQPHE